MKKVGSFLAVSLGHFWRLIALLLIFCALLVQLGRMATPMVADYREPVVEYLSNALGLTVAINSLDARWESLLPVLALEGLVISTPSGKVVLEIENALAEVDLVQSALDRKLRFSDVEFLGLRSNFVESADGSFSLEGLSTNKSVAKDSVATSYTLDNLRDVFLVGKQVNLIDLKTRIRLDSGHELEITVNRIFLEHDNNRHRLSATIQLEDRPEAISLIMEGSGDPFDISEFGSKAYVRVDDFPTEKLLALVARRYWESLPKGQWRRNGQASIEAWLTLTPVKGLSWLGKVKLSGLPFELKGKQVPFRSIDAEIVGDADFDGNWMLQLQNTNMQWGDTSHPAFSLQLKSNSAHEFSLNADQIVLQYWHKWLVDSQLLPSSIAEIFDQLNPQGALQNVHFSWPGEDPEAFQLRTNLANISAEAWSGAPAVTNVDGYLETTKASGFVDLDSREGFSMHYTSVYTDAMRYDAANGQVAWWVRPEDKAVYVNSGPIKLHGEDGDATGYLYINAPLNRDDHTLELLLQIGIENSSARYHKKYVPFVVSENLRDWLDQSVVAGDVNQGGFIFHGFIGGALARAPSVQLWLDIENAELDYMSPWPAVSEVKAELILDTAHLLVNASAGKLYDSTLHNAKVELASQENGVSNLLINGQVSGSLKDGQKLLSESPIAEVTNDTFATWLMDGRYSADVALNIPMGHNTGAITYDVRVDVKEGKLALPFLNLSATELNGGLQISDQTAIAINAMKGNLFGNSIAITSALNSAKSLLKLKLDARADIADLVAWAGFSDVKQAAGVSRYLVEIDVPWGQVGQKDSQVIVEVTSDLIGLSLALPEPLLKKPEQAIPFALQIPLDVDKLQVSASAGKFAQAALLWSKEDQSFKFDRGSVQLFGQARLPEQPMLRLGANIRRFDVSAWINAFEGQWEGIRAQPDKPDVLEVDEIADDDSADVVLTNENSLPLYIVLNTEALLLDGDKNIGASSLEGIKSPERWMFSFQNERLAGTLDLPLAEGSPLDLSLKVLRLPLWSNDEQITTQDVIPESAAELENLALEDADVVWQRVKSMPRIHTAISSLYVDEENIGQLNFNSYVLSDTWHIDNITGSLFGLSFSDRLSNTAGASLSWNHASNQSIFEGKVRAGDLGAVMTAFETEKLIESNSAVFNAKLAWSGDPYSVNLIGLHGDVDFQVKDGRFMRADASASNALMRLMGIFNFDTWIRRLQLDFSDVYASGMAYDEVKGALQFDRGLVQFNTPVSVKTPSSKMQMEGQVDLVKNTIDTRLTVNLPVLDNLTFIAAVSAGLPVAAGVFVASRLFEKQFDKMTSVNYRVVGALDSPTVQFKQVANSEKKNVSAPVTQVDVEEKDSDATSLTSPEVLPQQSTNKADADLLQQQSQSEAPVSTSNQE